jgi:BMFP domain-containing protein YqiC
VREMAVKARTEQEAMAMRLAALEGDRPASPEVSPEVSGAKSARKKPATPKSSKKTG